MARGLNRIEMTGDDVRVEEEVGVGGRRGEEKGERMGCAVQKNNRLHYYYF
jgi:hypothetical protein